MGRLASALLWLATRAAVLYLFFGPEHWVTGDITYYADSLHRLVQAGPADTLVEYPLPGVALVALPWLVAKALGRPEWYSGVVMALALVADAAFAVALRRLGGARRTAAVLAWVVAVPALGATAYARFDLVPGVLVGVAVLLVTTRPALAAAAAALATGAKYWPAVVLPAVAAPRPGRRRVLAVAAATGSALALASLLVAGWERLVSPLTWQAGRGLQIESVLAGPAMVGWALDPDAFTVRYSDHNAFEVSGRGVPLLLAGTDALTVVLVAGLLLLWWRAWARRDALPGETVGWLVLAAVSGYLVSSKVLSPQYLLWLLPAAAAMLAVAPRPSGPLLRWTVGLLLATGLTQLVFPVYYGQLLTPHRWSFEVTLLLVARNVLLVVLAVTAWVVAWRQVSGAAVQRGIPLERQPEGPDGSHEPTLR